MGAHFATIDGVFVAHSLFDEGVASLAFDGFAASGFDQIQGVPGQAGIVNDFAATGLAQELVRQQADDVVAFDEAAGFVEEEAAVVVAVPGNAHGGAILEYGIGSRGAVFRQDRVGHTIREVTIGFVMNLDEVERQMLFQFVDHQASTTVAGITDDGHGFQ